MAKMIPIKIRKNPIRNNLNPVELNAVMFPSFSTDNLKQYGKEGQTPLK
jgi:hypothetical protein